jgi:hypothetical protein
MPLEYVGTLNLLGEYLLLYQGFNCLKEQLLVLL